MPSPRNMNDTKRGGAGMRRRLEGGAKACDLAGVKPRYTTAGGAAIPAFAAPQIKN